MNKHDPFHLFPDKIIFIGIGFYFCAINEKVFEGVFKWIPGKILTPSIITTPQFCNFARHYWTPTHIH